MVTTTLWLDDHHLHPPTDPLLPTLRGARDLSNHQAQVKRGLEHMAGDTNFEWRILSVDGFSACECTTDTVCQPCYEYYQRQYHAGRDPGAPCPTQPVTPNVERHEFASGMVRDIEANKTDYTRLLDGPMLERWARHLKAGETRYPDVAPGVANWTLANGQEELRRFKVSALRHMIQWLRGDTNEDHAAAVYFNINGAEYVKERLG